jgi:hypothetical protein
MFQSFLTGFIKGARETPRAYFAPAVAVWNAFRMLPAITERMMRRT